MNFYKSFRHSSIMMVTQFMNDNMISKENIISLYHDGDCHILVYSTEKSYH